MRALPLGCAAPLLVAAVYLYLTEQIPVLVFGDPLGPRAFPRLIAAILVLSSVLWLAEALVRRPTQGDQPAPPETPTWLPVAVTTWFALYVLTLEAVGFVVGSTLFLLGLLAVFHPRRWATNVAVAIALPLSAYLVFTRILSVTLPAGSLLPT